MENKLKLHKLTEDLTGKIFGKLKVSGFAGYKKHCACWECKCECGIIKIYMAKDLKSGNSSSCGKCNKIRIGTRFGKLIVIEFADYYISNNGYRHTQLLCQCDCGNKKVIRSCHLQSKSTKSCGDCNPIKVGDKFGKLTVINTTKSDKVASQCLCRCVCGSVTLKSAKCLKNGSTKSCGDCNPIKIGDVFGKLTVLEFAGYSLRKKGWKCPQWLCACECGNKKIVMAEKLKQGVTKSCGCLPTNPAGGYSKKYNFSYDSSWELNFVKILEYLGVRWQRELETFKLSNGKNYTPDFYLPEFNMFIEIKGYWFPDKDGFSVSKEKTELFSKEYPEYAYYIIDTPKYREIEKHFKNILI